MNACSRLTITVLTVAGAALCLSACGPEAATQGDTPNPDQPGAHLCGAAMPACVTACGLDPSGQLPYCQDGRWYCEKGVPDTTCPDFGEFCDIAAPCAGDYTCVKSIGHPIPADNGICRKGVVTRDYDLESCSDQGALTAAEFLSQRGQLMGKIVKIAGKIGADIKCSQYACSEDNACCNTCVGDYRIALRNPMDPRQETVVTLSTEALACKGNTCDVSCAPLTVGDSYMVWGLLDSCKGQSNCTIFYMGGCPY